MKFRFLIIVCFLSFSSVIYAQVGKVTGQLKDSVSGVPLKRAVVNLHTQQKALDENGSFEFVQIPYGDYDLIIEADGYERFSVSVSINKETMDLGAILIKGMKSDGADNSEGVVSVQDLEDENKDQNISGPLHSSTDVFVSNSGYTLGVGGFRIRGYDSENSMVYFNGVSVNNALTGRAVWGEWGGLNDATRFKDITPGLSPASFTFGDIGGATNIDTRPSKQRKQTKISYAVSNKTYTNRVMATYSTGLLENGWAFTVSGSRRWGNGGFVEGTFYDAWAYFMGIEKKLNTNHSLAITCFAAPSKRGMQSSSTQETYDLVGTNFYNPNWGFQNGERRNARVKNINEPYVILNHYWIINSKLKINTAANYTFGRSGSTSLNWYNAADPRPDYYRYLPSYQEDPIVAAAVAEAWQTDISVRQLNWDRLYQINYLSKLEGGQSKYIIEERRMDYSQFNLNSNFDYEYNENITINGGVEAKAYKGFFFKTIEDLLGGDYWVDVDQFAERDFQADTILLQNDLNNPNRIVKEGDKFGYDYTSNINYENLWMQGVFSYPKFDFFTAASVNSTQFWRTGNMKNGRFPENSFGKSETKKFYNFGLKEGFTYKLTGRHFFLLTVGYNTQAPLFKNSMVSPRIRNDFIPGLTDEKVFSSEISYLIRHPKIKARFTAYQSMFWDQNEINSFYHDVLRTYVNYIMTGINKTHQGLELGVEYKATSTLAVTCIAAVGNYRYTSRPNALIVVDNGSVPDTTEVVYLKNFFISGTPQAAGSI